MTETVVFNGQGSEFAGMGKFLYQESLIFKENIDAANRCVDFDLPGYLFGATPLSARPEALQPALVAYMVALYRTHHLQPRRLLGLSLGEYAALIVGGMLTMEEGLAVVQTRGQAMAAACQASPGGMLALRVKDPVQAQPLLAQPGIWLANRNAPTQLVIGGASEPLEATRLLAKELGIKALPLKVAGAFHTPLMASAQPALTAALSSVTWRPGDVPIYSTTAQQRFTPENAVAVLTAQVASQTDLAQSLVQAVADGSDQMIEIGPRPVLAKLIRAQLPQVAVTTIDDTTGEKGE